MATASGKAATYAKRRVHLTPPPPAPSATITQMQQTMQKMMPGVMMMGFLIIVIGLGVGLFSATVVSDVFEATPAQRQAATIGTDLGDDIQFVNVTAAWLPSLLFLGMGMLLFSIAVTLMGILGGLRTMGENMYNVLSASEEN